MDSHARAPTLNRTTLMAEFAKRHARNRHRLLRPGPTAESATHGSARSSRMVPLVVLGFQLFSSGLLGETNLFTEARGIKDYQTRDIPE